MKNSELALAVFLEPGRAFSALREQPRFWFPLLFTAFACTVFFVWYYSVVDIAWLGEHIISSDPRMQQMSESERAMVAGTMSRNALMWATLISIVLGTAILRIVEALYFHLAGKAAAVPLSFTHWMALACWTAWPHILLVLVMFVVLLTSGNGQIAPEQLSLLSLNQVFFHTPAGSPWNTLLATLTLLHPWVWWLTVLGVRSWTGRSLAFSAVFALVPVVVLYGLWALIALL